jgi:hypothetical protein
MADLEHSASPERPPTGPAEVIPGTMLIPPALPWAIIHKGFFW